MGGAVLFKFFAVLLLSHSSSVDDWHTQHLSVHQAANEVA